MSRLLVRPWAALAGAGWDAVGEVPVGRGADIPAGEGVFLETFPRLFLELQPEPFRHALLDPAYQDRGRVDPFDAGGLVGGE
jgi:hypothetical protein